MPLRIEDQEKFSAWLIPTIRPLCDADPAALAKYVSALLKKKHTSEETHRQFCIEQLHVFLESKADAFVALLFRVVKNGEYLAKPKEDEMEVDTGPEVSALKPVKDEPIFDEAQKTPTIAEEPSPIPTLNSTRARNRQGNTGAAYPSRIQDRKPFHEGRQPVNEGRPPSLNEDRQPLNEGQQPLNEGRKPCRHYNERGFCLFGDRCRFEHGANPVAIPDQSFLTLSNLMDSKCFSKEPLGDIDESVDDKTSLTELYCHESQKIDKQIAHLWRIVGAFKREKNAETRIQLKQLFDEYVIDHNYQKEKLVCLMKRLTKIYFSGVSDQLKGQETEQSDELSLDRSTKEPKMDMDTC